jgi:hypothetical protein
MRYISVESEYFSAKFVPNPALLPELFLFSDADGVLEKASGSCITH